MTRNPNGTGRRGFFQTIAGVAGIGLLPGATAIKPKPLLPAGPVTGRQALAALMHGNDRYAAGHPQHPHQSIQRRHHVVPKQTPFATVLSCSDSRVPAELLFDVGIGDIFVIRTAGNVADPVAIGSIEYAVATFHTPLLVVLGHQYCGAIIATVRRYPAPGHIDSIVQLINPNIAGATDSKEGIEAAARANARAVAASLTRESDIIGAPARERRLLVVSAIYSLETGRVSLT
jgi:carbonic anhydrase